MLTTQQRDVLHLLLSVDAPLAANEIGERVELNQRQVYYSLRAVREWLARHNVTLQNVPGVGALVRCTPAQRQQLLADLRLNARFQLVLSADQRQQIVAFNLLTAVEPLVGRVAGQIDDLFFAQTGLRLAERHRHSLILLLHAAQTRARTPRRRRVLVVCPSGMATTQLLVARLRARFPGHGSYEVIPLRQLGPAQIAAADLIITTIPLELAGPTPVIQVRPALTPADIAALDPWMD